MQTQVWLGRVDAVVLLGVAVICVWRAAALGRARGPWAGLALATAALGTGSLVASPLALEASRLTGYAVGGTALVALGRPQFRQLSWSVFLDGVVAALTLAAVVTAIGPRGASYPLFGVLLLALVTVVAVGQGLRLSRESTLLAVSLAILAVSDALGSPALRTATVPSEVGLLAAALLVAAAAGVGPTGTDERDPERSVAIVAPTALSLVDVALLTDGRLVVHLSDPAMQLARLAFMFAFVRVFVSFVATQRMLGASLRAAASDALTGLPNRRALAADWSALAPERHVFAIYDLDGFKQYNDTFGHDAGDTLLSRLGARLATTVAGRGTAYRLGGDEFCVLASAGYAGGLVEEAAAALTVEGVNVSIRPSYGTALVPDEAADLTEALRLADRRMYGHKAARTALPAPRGKLRLTPGGEALAR